MAYKNQAIVLCFLMLFLQAFRCKRQTDSRSLKSAPAEASDKKLELGDQEKREDDDANPDPKSGYDVDPSFNPYSDPDFDPNPRSDYDSGYESDNETDTGSKPTLMQQLSPASDPENKNENFNIEDQILLLRKSADFKRGINWDLSGDRLIRAVDNSNSSLYAAEDYVVQVLNIYRAAKKICSLYEKDGSLFADKVDEFFPYAVLHLDQPEYFWIQRVKDINKAVVSQLEKRVFQNKDPDSINEKLRLAENYVGLDDTHYNVTTTFTIEDKKFALEDTKWLKLTDLQKSAYVNRKSEKWYTRLDPFEQKFIDAYVDKFLDGQHYIPTQLRSIPGCRNAYQKRILAYDQNNNQTVLGRYYHSGSLASPIEWEDKATDFQITKNNWEQITNQDHNVEVISLNYNMDLPVLKQAREKKIVADTKKVVGDDRFMNLSINGIGTSSSLRGQVDKLISESLSYYKSKYKKVHNALKKNNTKDNNKQIDKIKDPKDKSYFKRLGELEETAKASPTWNNLKQTTYITGNPNATACANYIACKSVLGQATSTPKVLFSCKSGKDRTGLMSYLADVNIIRMRDPSLGGDKGRKVCEALAYASHYQFLASVNGGMPGRFGMKPVRRNEISRSFTQQLFPKAAALTGIPLS